MKKKLTQFEKFELAEQARQSRDAEWQLAHDEMLAAYEGELIDANEYYGWFENNPQPSAIIEEQVRERQRYKRKSKKNIKNNINAKASLCSNGSSRTITCRSCGIPVII